MLPTFFIPLSAEFKKEDEVTDVVDGAFLNKAFKAVVDATEESILKSMLYSNTTVSYNGKVYKSLNEYKELFVELLEVEDD